MSSTTTGEATGSFKAVLWDFGGVISTSPFESFNRYEEANGLPRDLIRRLNATNPDTNAWAHLERSEHTMDEFAKAFEAEAAALGHVLDARAVFAALKGEIRPQMLAALDATKRAGLMNAGVTNNFAPIEPNEDASLELLDKFDFVVESSKVGLRKPDPRIYELVCQTLGVSPQHCVFLDDLGVNLKPARAMGMTTIKVVDPDAALGELAVHLGIDLT